nr:ABC transporter ATP-binding protein [Streptomyces chartreusis]
MGLLPADGNRRAGGQARKIFLFSETGKRLFYLLRPGRSSLAAAVILGLLNVVCTVTSPLLLGRATDLIFAGVTGKSHGASPSQQQASAGADDEASSGARVSSAVHIPDLDMNYSAISSVLLGVALLYIAAAFFDVCCKRLATRAIQQVGFRLRRDAQTKCSRLSLKYVDSRPSGDILSRITNDVENISQCLQQSVSYILNALLTLFAVSVMMFWVSPLLAFIFMCFVPLSAVVATKVGKRAQVKFIQQWEVTGELTALVDEAYTGCSVIRVFGRRNEAKRIFEACNDHLYKSSYRAHFLSGMIQPLFMMIGNINYVIIAVIGGIRIASGAMSIGDVQAFVQYSRQFGGPVTQVANLANQLQSGIASARRVFELLDVSDEPPGPLVALSESEHTVCGRISFQDVGFRYDPAHPFIDSLSFDVEPGQTVAIVGPSGAGKTTLVNLLLRFYEIDSGSITLDNIDISTMSLEWLRSNIGTALQDAWIFEGTIAENIAYGAPGASRQEVIEAAVAAQVDHLVRTLPNGYDTILSEENCQLSGGEKQMIAIARALLVQPAVLIMDEATGSVDTQTEIRIQSGMARLRSGRTCFVIAHRFSTIRDADLILVMDNGAVVDQGSHEDLLVNSSIYASLYRSQLSLSAE